MKHWRKPNKQHASTDKEHREGIELSLQELLDCKRVADQLQLPTHQKVKTHLLGGFMSHHKGRGMDFDEARLYQQGDDIRSIDWRVTARTGEAHTKLFKEERERPVFVLLDQSAGMMFGTRQQFKGVLAAHITAVIRWRTLSDGNRFGALLFNNEKNSLFKPSSSRKNCLRVLNNIVDQHNQQLEHTYNRSFTHSAHTNTLAEALLRNRHIARPGSLIFIVSDFNQFDADCEHHLVRLAQHNEVHLAHICDPIEKEVPPPGYYTFTDGLHKATLNTNRKQVRRQFQSHYLNFSHQLKNLCQRHKIKLSELTTASDSTQLTQLNKHLFPKA